MDFRSFHCKRRRKRFVPDLVGTFGDMDGAILDSE
jgi:hypothetical protein